MKGQGIIEEDIQQIIETVGIEAFRLLEGATMLITGPNGLLASYIIDTVVMLNRTTFKKPCTILGIVRSPLQSTDRLAHLYNPQSNVYFIKHDSIEFGVSFDYVIHAAGRSAPSSFVNDPIRTLDLNTLLTRGLLLRATRQTKSFIFFSSGELYGSPPPEWIPTPESYKGQSDPLGVRGPYIEGKRSGEAYCMAFYRTEHVPVKILRPFLVYGPGLDAQTDQRVMAQFLKQAMQGQPIVMLDQGTSLRAYCYIMDAMIMFWKIFFSDNNGEAFNIGNQSEEISIRGLAEQIHEVCGISEKPSTIADAIIIPALVSAPQRVWPDMRKVKKMFDYEAKVSLREGLTRTLQWNREKLS